MHSIKRFTLIALMALAGFAMTASAADQDEAVAAQVVVDSAVKTLENFWEDSTQGLFRENLSKAHALFIIPRLGKGGFIFGGSGGRGVVVARDRETGSWSQPAFYTIGSASVGLLIGAQESEVIYLMMSEASMHALLGTKIQVGGDSSVATGPVGVGIQAATTDVLSFSRGKGLYGGLSGEATVIQPDLDRNTAYYGKVVSSTEILLRNAVQNDEATALVAKVSETTAPRY